ncbi:MAG: hypothetical protein R3B47_00995 [Bacteroidia bacterium]
MTHFQQNRPSAPFPITISKSYIHALLNSIKFAHLLSFTNHSITPIHLYEKDTFPQKPDTVWAVLLQVTICPAAHQVPADSVGMSSGRLEFLTNTFQQYVDDGELSGSVVLVARKNRIAYFEAFGKSDMENKVPMTENAIFASPHRQKQS